jgi:putative ABC transport system permease protein
VAGVDPAVADPALGGRAHSGASRRRAARPGASRLGPARLASGLACLAAGLAAVIAGAVGSKVTYVGPGALALVISTLALAPLALVPSSRLIGTFLVGLRGASARLAEQNVRRDPRRSAASGTALVVGVATVTLFTVFAASMKSAIGTEVRDGFAADLAVNTAAFGGSRLSPDLAGKLSTLPAIGRAVAIGGGRALVDGRSEVLTATDPAAVGSVVAVRTRQGALRTLGRDGLAVSEGQARRQRWTVGDQVTLTFADGVRTQLTVRAVYADNPVLGGFVVDRQLWASHTAQPTDRTVLLTVRSGSSVADARTQVTPLATRYGGDVQDRDGYAAATTRGLDLLLGLVYVLLALGVVIALVGIANALSLTVHERRREIGLLRAVGQTRRQARSVLRLEAMIVSAFGTLVGLALGATLGWALFDAVSDTPGFTLPAARLSLIALLGALAGVLAARRPARQAANLPILDALAAS